jgi:vacuole morphology and inheritance protein 14
MNLLITIDKLVQLIESSVFTCKLKKHKTNKLTYCLYFIFQIDLRLHLLDVERNQYLVRALYGLLMILPQSDAFMLLKRRLDCVPNFFNKISNDALPITQFDNEQVKKANKYEIDFDMLLNHFVQVQEKHRFFKNSKRIIN